MQRLNAIDAITPAFARTHEILFQPFRVGRSWKLAAAQYFGMIGAFYAPMPLMFLFIPTSELNIGSAGGWLAIVFLVATILFFALFYLGLRMQFVNFEMVVTRATFVGPMWRRYGRRIWPVVGFKVMLGTLITFAVAPFLWKSIAALIDLLIHMPKLAPGQVIDPAIFQSVFARILSLEVPLIAALLLIKLISSVFEDFVMPFFILEDITLPIAIRRACAVFVADPLHCILYVSLKPILFILGGILQYVSMVVLTIPILIVAVLVAVIGVAISAVLGGAHGAAHLLGFAAGAVLYVAMFGLTVWYQLGTLGYISMLLQAYSAYFLGGRYALLGSMLEPGPDANFTPPPVFPSEDEDGDDDDGPPMPMDPAVA